jgi:hypothetical protein
MPPLDLPNIYLPKVRTEMSLQILAYNIKRVIKILGARKLIEAIAT